jgi:hypothetical protein
MEDDESKMEALRASRSVADRTAQRAEDCPAGEAREKLLLRMRQRNDFLTALARMIHRASLERVGLSDETIEREWQQLVTGERGRAEVIHLAAEETLDLFDEAAAAAGIKAYSWMFSQDIRLAQEFPDPVKPNQWRKRAVTVLAMQWTGENTSQIIDWALENSGWSVRYREAQSAVEDDSINEGRPATPACLMIDTLEGTMCASLYDWLIIGVERELYPCKPAIFAKTYEVGGGPQ